MALEAQEVAVRIKLLGGAAFKAQTDEAAESLERVGAAGKKLSSEGGIRTAGNHVEKLGNNVSKAGSKMIGFGRTLSMVGVPIAAIGYLAGKSAAQFNQAMMLLVTQANMPLKSLKKVSMQVQDLAAKFGSTPLAAAKAMYSIESVGLRGKAAQDALKASLMGTAIGLDDLSSTSDAVTTAMASHIKGVHGPIQAMAAMDKAVGLGKMHLQDLTDSFKSGIIPMSHEFGMSFQQILAAAAGLTRVGVPASQVMARMRLTMTSMAKPTVEGAAAIAQMGIGPNQLLNELRGPGGLLAAFATLKAHADLLPHDTAIGDIADIFGRSRGIANALGVLQQLPEIQRIAGGVMGANQSQFDRHMALTAQTPAFKYKQIEAQFEKVMIRFGTAVNQYVLPVLVKLIPVMQSVLKWFSGLSMGTKKLMLGILALSVVGGPILMFGGALLKIAGTVITAIGWIGRLGTTAEAVAVGSGTSGGGLAAFGLGLARVIPALALFALALHVAPKIAARNKADVHAGHQLFGGSNARKNLTSHNVQDYLTNKPVPNAILGAMESGAGKAWHALEGIFADGGVMANAGLALVGERGPELLSLPRGSVVKPQGSSAFDAEIAHNLLGSFGGPHGGMVGGTQIFQVVLDGKVLAQSVNNSNRKAQNRR